MRAEAQQLGEAEVIAELVAHEEKLQVCSVVPHTALSTLTSFLPDFRLDLLLFAEKVQCQS